MQIEVNNSWYEKGELPPVGAKVILNCIQFDRDHGFEFHGTKAEILVHTITDGGNKVAVFVNENRGYHGLVAHCFLPIKSEREKAIEAALKPILSAQVEIKSIKWASDIAGNLYDAGLLRLPGDK